MDKQQRVLAAIAGEPVDPSRGALGEQLEALNMIRDHVGPEVPIVATMTPDQFERFQRPFDAPIFEACTGPFNIMHMCASAILLDQFAGYPASVFNWAAAGRNPSLTEVHRRTGKAVLGGLPGKPSIAGMSKGELLAYGQRSLEEMNARFHLFGPDCSINPDTPRTLVGWVKRLFPES